MKKSIFMKPTEFFITKTESFLEELRAFKLVPYDFATAWNTNTNDIYKEDIKSDNDSTYESQNEELNDIKFQMNLMFSEFDNGALFTEKLNGHKHTSFDNEPLLKHLINVSELFIDFLEEYRVSKV